jgi:hypothetical protein
MFVYYYTRPVEKGWAGLVPGFRFSVLGGGEALGAGRRGNGFSVFGGGVGIAKGVKLVVLSWAQAVGLGSFAPTTTLATRRFWR